MNKQDRLALIKSRAANFGLLALAGVLATSRHEIKGEMRAVNARFADSMDDNIHDNDKIEATVSSLSFDNVESERESDVLLSREERNRLAREYKKPAKPAVIVSAETESFAGNPNAVYVSELAQFDTNETLAQAKFEANFELDVLELNGKLALMA